MVPMLIIAPGALLITDAFPSSSPQFHVSVPVLINFPPFRTRLSLGPPPNVPPLHRTTPSIHPPLQSSSPVATGTLLLSTPPVINSTGGVSAPVPLRLTVPPEITKGVVIG